MTALSAAKTLPIQFKTKTKRKMPTWLNDGIEVLLLSEKAYFSHRVAVQIKLKGIRLEITVSLTPYFFVGHNYIAGFFLLFPKNEYLV